MKIFLPHRRSAMTLMDVMIVIATLAFMATFFLVVQPFKRKSKARGITCVNNLKQVGISFRLWAGDNNDNYPMHVSTNLGGTMEFAESPEVFRHIQVLSNELGTPKATVCPQDISRKYSSNFFNFRNLNVSYFVGIDANETNATMILTGERHITNGFVPNNGVLNLMTNQNVRWSKELHDRKNNIGLADGSVQQVSSKVLRLQLLPRTGFATNRIVLP